MDPVSFEPHRAQLARRLAGKEALDRQLGKPLERRNSERSYACRARTHFTLPHLKYLTPGTSGSSVANASSARCTSVLQQSQGARWASRR